jgi:hypothetical protein
MVSTHRIDGDAMMDEKPDFYLVSCETAVPFGPIACFVIERLTGRKEGDDFLRVRIEPSLVGQTNGPGDKDIEDLVLATRHTGSSLHPVNEWPMMVFVCRILNASVRGSGTASVPDLEVLLIGEVHETLADAVERLLRCAEKDGQHKERGA